jgi:hypothetical protein
LQLDGFMTLRRIAVLAVVSLSIAVAAGCSAPSEDEFDDAQQADDEEEDEGPVASSESELGGCNQCTNCVKYARCRQPRLPSGLTYWRDKVARINSRTPRRGCVAMIQTSSAYGHVAFVTGVSGGRISIAEGNWPTGRCGQRSGTPAALNVRGYWCP